MARRRASLGYLGVCAVASLAVLTGSAAASFHGRNGRIAWSVFSGGGGGGGGFKSLTTYLPTGGGQRVLGHCAQDASGNICGNWDNVAYSPNGRRLAWDQPDATGHQVIILANADATHPTVVSHDALNDSQASFAPGGHRIVYIRSSLGGGGFGTIATSDLSGGTVRIVSASIQAAEPQFTPDGRRILFRRSGGVGMPSSLWSIGTGGHHAHRLIPRVFSFDISPNGRLIAYVNGAGDLYVARSDGTGRHRLARQPDGSDAIDGVRFSPNGRLVAFTAQSPNGNLGESLYVVSLGGGHPHAIVHTNDARAMNAGLSWQPRP